MSKTIDVENLQLLIEELTKTKPNQTKVKKLMTDHGLSYTPDAIQQMSTVLMLMSAQSPDIRKAKPKEKVTEV